MQIGMIGLGRMGANMVRRLTQGGHQCVVYDRSAAAVAAAVADGASGAGTAAELLRALKAPRAIWIMVPAAVVDTVIAELRPLLERGDVLIDGGNSNYHDDIRRADELGASGIHYVDVGTSGGVLGLERRLLPDDGRRAGHGGARRAGAGDALARRAAARGDGGRPCRRRVRGGARLPALRAARCRTLRQDGPQRHRVRPHGRLRRGPESSHARRRGTGEQRGTMPRRRRSPTRTVYQYQLDVAAIAEVWRHGSIITSRLLDLTAEALARDGRLAGFAGRVADSGEGRWTVEAAIDVGVPAYVLSAALYSRFESRDRADFANKVLSAMRLGFGGHLEKSG